MHEMGIAIEIIDIATASIPVDMPSAKVARINLNIGKLSAVVGDSLRFCFEAASKNTPLDGAELVITEIPVEAQCDDCRHRWIISSPAFLCENCTSGSIKILSGRELDIDSIELAEEET